MGPDPLGTVYDEISESAVPDWAIALTTASAGGIYLVDDPIGFVMAVVFETIVGGAFSIAGQFANLIMAFYVEAASVVLGLGMIPVGIGSAIGELLLGLVGMVVDLMSALAASAGPFAPVVIALQWVVVGYALIAMLNAIKRILPLVIPWL